MAAIDTRQRITRALRHRNYRLFFSGQSVSLVGTWITRIATSWLVYRLTGSAFLLAPLVEVAWVDGDVSHAERDTILHIAKQRGVAPGQQQIILLDPAGNWIALSDSRGVG